MNRERFVAEAGQVGIERSAALSLFERLYATPERGSELSATALLSPIRPGSRAPSRCS